MIKTTEQWAEDFLSSERLLFLDSSDKEYIADILMNAALLLKERKTPWIRKDIMDTLILLAERLNLPLATRQRLPGLLGEFFEFVADNGGGSSFASLKNTCDTVQTEFLSRLRADGTVKGATLVNAVQAVGRNDPCPCGSGKKFKKCCGG